MSDQTCLATQNVSLSFGGLTVLKDVSLQFLPGEVTGLIGPNGAGKTSFFNCLTGHYRPVSGRIVFGGEDLTNIPTEGRARRGIARTFQHAALSPELTLLENVVVGLNMRRSTGWLDALLPLPAIWTDRDEARARAREALRSVGLADRENVLAGEAAPGVMRLVELARARVGEPRAILLDEPAAGLNSAETAACGEVVTMLRAPDRAVVIVEHDMELIMSVCDRIHVLNFGEVVASGTPGEIQRDPKVAEIYLGASHG
ncbi:ABC transporter ATP-binding protein [Acuticoccus kandeliae]|uniref:ABC transporter ATP-binding protein n=1 Tax=Acuticoccus kandeliae TaxID=2073160 RepID=UPI000D3ECCAE|nr:ABC transporter ATP-binding protein [Acuticoccus kandeliae]